MIFTLNERLYFDLSCRFYVVAGLDLGQGPQGPGPGPGAFGGPVHMTIFYLLKFQSITVLL